MEVHKRLAPRILTSFLSKASPDSCRSYFFHQVLYHFMLVYILCTYVQDLYENIVPLVYPSILSLVPSSYMLLLDVLCLVADDGRSRVVGPTCI
jgi:hypothetical protein